MACGTSRMTSRMTAIYLSYAECAWWHAVTTKSINQLLRLHLWRSCLAGASTLLPRASIHNIRINPSRNQLPSNDSRCPATCDFSGCSNHFEINDQRSNLRWSSLKLRFVELLPYCRIIPTIAVNLFVMYERGFAYYYYYYYYCYYYFNITYLLFW